MIRTWYRTAVVPRRDDRPAAADGGRRPGRRARSCSTSCSASCRSRSCWPPAWWSGRCPRRSTAARGRRRGATWSGRSCWPRSLFLGPAGARAGADRARRADAAPDRRRAARPGAARGTALDQHRADGGPGHARGPDGGDPGVRGRLPQPGGVGRGAARASSRGTCSWSGSPRSSARSCPGRPRSAVFVATMVFRYGQRGGLRRYSQVWKEVVGFRRRSVYLREVAMGPDGRQGDAGLRARGLVHRRVHATRRTQMLDPVAARRRQIYLVPYLAVHGDRAGDQRGGAGVHRPVRVRRRDHADRAGARHPVGRRRDRARRVLPGVGRADAVRDAGRRGARRSSRTRMAAAEARLGSSGPGLPVPAGGARRRRSGSRTCTSPTRAAAGPVLDGLDLELPAGLCTAIVGVNGAGKTTLVKLLTRLHEPTAGRITVDGTDLADLDVAAWRRQVSVVFQDFVRYELSAADNIARRRRPRPARPRRGPGRGASARASLDAVDALPAGFDTTLSRAYEGGADLSGGQWQRIAIARSLYALEAGARVLVLDEPTSALDVRAEAAFFDRFVELTRGVTSVLISHRFSSVRRADRIVVIDARPGGRAGHARRARRRRRALRPAVPAAGRAVRRGAGRRRERGVESMRQTVTGELGAAARLACDASARGKLDASSRRCSWCCSRWRCRWPPPRSPALTDAAVAGDARRRVGGRGRSSRSRSSPRSPPGTSRTSSTSSWATRPSCAWSATSSRSRTTRPGIEHHERPEYADRLQVLRTELNRSGWGSMQALLSAIGLGVALVDHRRPARPAQPVAAAAPARRACRRWSWAAVRRRVARCRARAGRRRRQPARTAPVRPRRSTPRPPRSCARAGWARRSAPAGTRSWEAATAILLGGARCVPTPCARPVSWSFAVAYVGGDPARPARRRRGAAAPSATSSSSSRWRRR